LGKIENVKVTDLGEHKSGIVTFMVNDRPAQNIKRELSKMDINVSICPKDSTLIDSNNRDLPELVRASIHYYNTEEEIMLFCQALEEILA